MVERDVCFPLNLPKPHLAWGTFKDGVLQQKYIPSSIAEDPRIAFLQSNIFWQVSCAKSKTKACTEISAWTIAGMSRISWENFSICM